MDPNLVKILAVFVMYCFPGFLCLYWVKTSSSKLEIFIAGLFLICWAAFTLTIIAVSTGAAEALLTDKTLSETSIAELKDFVPYIFIFGAIYTFLFGGVGTNAVSTALIGQFSPENSLDLKRLEQKIENTTKQVNKINSIHWKYLFINIFLFFLYAWVSK
jgi:hypothetical protein